MPNAVARVMAPDGIESGSAAVYFSIEIVSRIAVGPSPTTGGFAAVYTTS